MLVPARTIESIQPFNMRTASLPPASSAFYLSAELLPAVCFVTCPQVPAWTSSSSSSSSGGMYVWPVLLLGGVPLNPDKALPAVHRPSITIKVSLRP